MGRWGLLLDPLPYREGGGSFPAASINSTPQCRTVCMRLHCCGPRAALRLPDCPTAKHCLHKLYRSVRVLPVTRVALQWCCPRHHGPR